MRKRPEKTHRQPPEWMNRESIQYSDDAIVVEPQEKWVHVGGGWYDNTVTGERQHGKPNE